VPSTADDIASTDTWLNRLPEGNKVMVAAT
jgi:hypothetical protein